MKRQLSVILSIVLIFSCTSCARLWRQTADRDGVASDEIVQNYAEVNGDGEASYEEALKKYLDAVCEFDIDTMESLSPYTTGFGPLLGGDMQEATREELEEEIKTIKEDGYRLTVKNYKIDGMSYGTKEVISDYNTQENLKGSIEEIVYLDVMLTTLYKPNEQYVTEEETSKHEVVLFKINNSWYVASMK